MNNIIIIIINEYYLGAVKSQELLEHLTRLRAPI